MPSLPFLNDEETVIDRPYEDARAVILPLPFERTTSYGRGTAAGPEAILRASQFVELYDDELRTEPHVLGISTLDAFEPSSQTLGPALDEICDVAEQHLRAGKFLASLGGEHSLTAPLVRGAARGLDLDPVDLGVVQFDAHSDLRDTYEGTPHSHAAVMHRVLDDGFPAVAVGIRSLSTREAELIDSRNLSVIWAQEMVDAESTLRRFESLLEELPDSVYLTFDIDYFDPSLVPATGTPEPGGGTWWPTLALMRTLFRKKNVVAMDLVELAPIPHQTTSDFLAAKLLYKCLGYLGENG